MTINQRFGQYRNILSQKPQHEKALQECFKQKELDDYDRLFLLVFAPAAVEFTEWVLKQAVKDGKRRLYFLARDGWLFYQLAAELVKKYKYDIEIRYLKVSRYSMRSASYHLMGETCLEKICVGAIDSTFEKIMKQASLTDTEARKIARLSGYDTRYRQILNYRMIQQLKEKLKQIPLFFEYVNAHAKSCYNAAVGYLIQEGLKETVPYAVVDSGWTGTLLQSMELLVEKPIMGYYFGLYEIPKGADGRYYRAFYFMPGRQIKRKVNFSNCLFETIFSAPEGMTYGYQLISSDGRADFLYKPVENKQGNPNAEKMRRNAELLSAYVKEYYGDGRDVVSRTEKKSTDMMYHLFRLLMGKPEQFEAEILTRLKFCDDMLETDLRPLAETFLRAELKKRNFINRILIKFNIKRDILHESAWTEAGIVLYGRNIRYHLLQEKLYKYFMYAGKAINKGEKD